MKSKITRRSVLRGLGATGCMAPFLPMTEVQAETSGFPTRLILLFSPNGSLHERWVPTGTETNFTLGPILEPLAHRQDQLVILDNVARSGAGPGDMHQKGIGILWSGSQLLEGEQFTGGAGSLTVGWGGGQTVDQYIADAIGDQTAFRSLELAVYPGNAGIWSRMSYAGADQPIPPDPDPRSVFDRLFADLGTSSELLEQIRAERGSVIDVVRDQLSTLRPQISSNDRLKLDAHLEGIREIERRNELELTSCSPGELNPDVVGEDFEKVSRAQIDNLVTAMSCDLTRVAGLQWSRAISQMIFDWIPGHDTSHHDLSHLGDSNPKMTTQLTEINQWYAGQVAYLLDALAAVPEGNGTMLDNTLVVWGNELGRGNAHSNFPIPFVLAGNAGGRIQTGRWLDRGEQWHNRLLVSICHAMGLDEVQTFGDTDTGSGGFPDLVG